MDACKDWLKKLKRFCSYMGYVGSDGQQFTTEINGKEYIYVKDLQGDVDRPVKLFR